MALLRDYTHLDQYLNTLEEDIYPQPADPLHTQWALEAIQEFLPKAVTGRVLDVGCGSAFCEPVFRERGLRYLGVSLGDDAHGPDIDREDFSFLPYADDSFDLIFARHALEHSPMPILTLMEWRRVSRGHLILILPTPQGWGYGGRNHYSVFPKEVWDYLLERTFWKVEKFREAPSPAGEYRYLCRKL